MLNTGTTETGSSWGNLQSGLTFVKYVKEEASYEINISTTGLYVDV